MNNKGFSNGLIAGLITIILLLVIYFIHPESLVKYGAYLGYVIFLIFMYKSGKEARDEAGGLISFGTVLGPIFLTFVLGSLIVTLFNYILYNFIDASLSDIMMEIAMEQIEKMSGFIGEEGVEAAMEEIENSGFQLTIGKSMLNWAFALIIPGIIFALIEAAILKKEDKNAI